MMGLKHITGDWAMRTWVLALWLLTAGSGALADDTALEVGLLELVNYHEYSASLLSSGQPTREQFPAIRAAGIEAIINLAPVTDPASLADEQQIVEGLGIPYTHIPVDWDHPGAADFARFLAAMESYQGKRILVHCYAGSRASAFVYLYRLGVQGAARDDAHATLVDIWDNNPGYELDKVAQWLTFIAAEEARFADATP